MPVNLATIDVYCDIDGEGRGGEARGGEALEKRK